MKAPKSKTRNLTSRLIGPADAKIVLWRWNPGPWLRKRGFKGVDLWADGPFMTKEELAAYGFTPPTELRCKGTTPMQPSDAARMARALNAATVETRPSASAQPRKPSKTISNLFDAYLESAAYKKLAPKTQMEYAHHLRRLRDWCGPFEPRALTFELIEGYIFGMDGADGVFQKNGHHIAWHLAKTLRLVLNWGQKRDDWRGRLPDREVYSNIGVSKPSPRLRVDLPGELDAMLLAFDDPQAIYAQCEEPSAGRILLPRPSGGDALMAMLWTCARVHDALCFSEQAYDGKTIVYRPSKWRDVREGSLEIPVLPPLKTRLDDAVRRKRAIMGAASADFSHIIIDETERTPYARISEKTGVHYHKAFNNLWAERRALAGKIAPSLIGEATDRTGRPIPPFNAQDCRDVAVSRLARAGCTLWQLCSWHGSSPKNLVQLAGHYIEIGASHAVEAGEKLIAMAKAEGINS